MQDFAYRLIRERHRLKLTQTQFGVAGGVKMHTQLAYEKGTSHPDSRYLIKLGDVGVDIPYLLFGGKAMSSQNEDEQILLMCFRRMRDDEQAELMAKIDETCILAAITR